MATANIVETQPEREGKKDEIVLSYEKILAEVAELQDAFDFWDRTIDSPFMRRFLEKQRRAMSDERERWDHIKTSEFPESRAQVKAFAAELRAFERQADDARAELNSKKQLKANLEIQYPLILKGAGYEFDLVKSKAEAVNAESAPEDSAPEGRGILVKFAENPPDQDIVAALHKVGFEESEDDALLFFRKKESKAARKYCESLKDNDAIEEVRWGVAIEDKGDDRELTNEEADVE